MKRRHRPARRDSCRRDRPESTAAPATARICAGRSRWRKGLRPRRRGWRQRERMPRAHRGGNSRRRREARTRSAASRLRHPSADARAPPRGPPARPASLRRRPRRSRRATGPPQCSRLRSRAGRPRTKVRHRPAFFRTPGARSGRESTGRRSGGFHQNLKKHESPGYFNEERCPSEGCRWGPHRMYATQK